MRHHPVFIFLAFFFFFFSFLSLFLVQHTIAIIMSCHVTIIVIHCQLLVHPCGSLFGLSAFSSLEKRYYLYTHLDHFLW